MLARLIHRVDMYCHSPEHLDMVDHLWWTSLATACP